MENPATWTPVHHAIHVAITEYDNAVHAAIEDERDFVCGYSLEATIYNKLVEKGLIK